LKNKFYEIKNIIPNASADLYLYGEIVVIDTAPTGHTLLLLDETESYHKEVQRTHGDSPASV